MTSRYDQIVLQGDDLRNDRFDIKALITGTVTAAADYVAFYDASTSTHKKVLVDDLPGGGGSTSPLTTKGDIWGYDTADNRIPVGTNGQLLFADSGQALGVGWATPDTDDISEGSRLYYTDERAQDGVGTILTDTATIDFTYDDGTPQITADVIQSALDHGSIGGLTDDDHVAYVRHNTGRATPNIIVGGTGASDSLTLESTSNATKGSVIVDDHEFTTVGTELRHVWDTGDYQGYDTSANEYVVSIGGVETIIGNPTDGLTIADGVEVNILEKVLLGTDTDNGTITSERLFLYDTQTISDGSNWQLTGFRTLVELDTTNITSAFIFNAAAVLTVDGITLTNFRGLNFVPQLGVDGGCTVSNVWSVNANPQVATVSGSGGTGNLTDVIGLRGQNSYVTFSGTTMNVTNSYGARVGDGTLTFGTLNVTTSYGYYVATLVGTTDYGLYLESSAWTGSTLISIYSDDSAAEVRHAGPAVFGAAAAPTNSSVGLEVQSTTLALLVSSMTTTQRNALTAANGMVIYNTTTGAFNFREGGAWVTGSGLT